jgi:type IV secretory pathway TrbF-like protein
MKLKLSEIQKAQQPLQKIMNADLPIKIAFRLSRMAKAVNDVFTDIETQRVKLVEKYGTSTDKGVTVNPENVTKFQEEFGTFIAEESVELKVEPIKLELLEGLQLTALDMLALEPFISE